MSARPWRSALLCACAAGASLFASPGRWLVYDRAAVARGQWWRLLSGSLVHFSPLHAALDLGAVLLAGGLLERQRYPRWWRLCLLAAAGGGGAVQWLRPDLRWYGGLSGVAVAMVAALCLDGLGQRSAWGWACAAALALLLAKLAWEFGGGSLSAAAGAQAYVVVPQAHAAGLAAAALLRLSLPPAGAGSDRGSSAAQRSNPSRRPEPGGATPW
jgi:rhomboid family GlyGly-CTERM serine protease